MAAFLSAPLTLQPQAACAIPGNSPPANCAKFHAFVVIEGEDMKALIVIDMQEDYTGQKRNQKRYPYDSMQLIKSINARITNYEQHTNSVIYIKNKGKSAQISALVEGLNVVSDLCFTKEKASCFSNPEFISYLIENNLSQLELAGVDGNYCVGMSAIDGAKKGFDIHISLSCVGIVNDDKFQTTKEKMLKAGVQIYD